jgi:hypothetical protein
LGSSKSTSITAADFKYSMRGKVISITYSGTSSINKEIGRILRRIEHWHQGSVKSFKILYQDPDGLGGEVKWEGENAEVIAPPLLIHASSGLATVREHVEEDWNFRSWEAFPFR